MSDLYNQLPLVVHVFYSHVRVLGNMFKNRLLLVDASNHLQLRTGLYDYILLNLRWCAFLVMTLKVYCTV